MRLQIGKIWLIAIIGIATASEAKAQLVSSNPLEWMALAEGNELINSEIEKQINGQTKTALLQNTMAAEFNQIHKWEKKYNSSTVATGLCIGTATVGAIIMPSIVGTVAESAGIEGGIATISVAMAIMVTLMLVKLITGRHTVIS